MKPLLHHCKHPRLPNDKGPAVCVSCGQCGPAGKGRAHSPTTASGTGALRGSSMLVGDAAGERDLPTAQREASPLMMPSSRAIGAVESRRAVDCAAPAAAGAWSAPALLLGTHVKRGARTCGGANRQVLLASNVEIASTSARAPRSTPLHHLLGCP